MALWVRPAGIFASRRARSLTALVCLGLMLIAVNIIAGRFLTARLDLTAERLYTLSQGTRQTLAHIDEPITLRLYYTTRLGDAVLRAYEERKRLHGLLDFDDLVAIELPRGYGEIERTLRSAPEQHQESLTAIQPTPKILTPARRRTRATSSRNPGRHHLGSPRRLRRNPHAHAEETAERHDGVGNSPGGLVDHEIVHRAETLALAIKDGRSYNLVGRQ